MAVVARTRSRAAPAPAPRKMSPWDVPVVGGPKAAMSMGQPLFSQGVPTKGWPYVTGSELIGFRLDETRHKQSTDKLYHYGTDIRYVCTHAWQLRGGELRYLGQFPSRDRAETAVENAATRPADPVQPVAVRSRVRAVVRHPSG